MRELRQYYRHISSWLPCGGKCRRQIMNRIRDRVEAYLEETPNVDMQKIKARFGEPQEIAIAYVSDMDTGELLTALRVRRRIMAIVLAVVMFTMVSWSGSVLWAIQMENRSLDGYTEDALIEGKWQEDGNYDDVFD